MQEVIKVLEINERTKNFKIQEFCNKVVQNLETSCFRSSLRELFGNNFQSQLFLRLTHKFCIENSEYLIDFLLQDPNDTVMQLFVKGYDE